MGHDEAAVGDAGLRQPGRETVLNLSGWTMPRYPSTTQYAFGNRANLMTLYEPAGCNLSDTGANDYCFSQCSKLKGDAGAAYSSGSMMAATGERNSHMRE